VVSVLARSLPGGKGCGFNQCRDKHQTWVPGLVLVGICGLYDFVHSAHCGKGGDLAGEDAG
jgi:hypothetical protein